jgi:hypothetical protein
VVDLVVVRCVSPSLVHPVVAALNLYECSLYIRDLYFELSHPVGYNEYARSRFELLVHTSFPFLRCWWVR